jgi:uncharacterized repeat protein (TIGR02543 family)
MAKKGDTLIEVCIAIGIFSLIAIGVASVMSSGTAGSQTALETTLAREEIDSQADALRFIHESYMGSKNASENEYTNLWNLITRNAIKNPSDSVTQYAPESCKSLYEGNVLRDQKAFILNTRQLNASHPENAYISFNSKPNVFKEAITYPRLLFGSAGDNTGTDSLLDDSNNLTNLYRAEGVYIVAVEDPKSTQMIVDGDKTETVSAYYDFYIRSCWYGSDAERPTTPSTVIRLYDPPEVKATAPVDAKYTKITFQNANNPPAPTFTYSLIYVYAGESKQLADPKAAGSRYERQAKYRFNGWKPRPASGTCGHVHSHYDSGEQFASPGTLSQNCFVDLIADWNVADFKVTLDANGGDFPDSTTQKTETCGAFQPCEYSYTIPSKYFSDATRPTKSGFRFDGWNTKADGTGTNYTASSANLGQLKGDTTLYAKWAEQNETITISANWTSNTDYDSYMQLSIPGSNSYQSASWGTLSIDVNYMGRTINLIKGAGDGRGHINGRYSENFEINTLGGKNYYYSMHNWSTPKYIGNDITITVSGPYIGTKVFKSTTRTDCNYWNVFAYKNGRIVERNTCSNSMEYNY